MGNIAFILVAFYSPNSDLGGMHAMSGFEDRAACVERAKTAPPDLVEHVWCIPADDWLNGQGGVLPENEVKRGD